MILLVGGWQLTDAGAEAEADELLERDGPGEADVGAAVEVGFRSVGGAEWAGRTRACP